MCTLQATDQLAGKSDQREQRLAAAIAKAGGILLI